MALVWIGDDDPDPIIDGDELRHNQDDTLTVCCLCGNALDEDDAVKTKYGLAHEECAEQRWPLDPGDTRYPR